MLLLDSFKKWAIRRQFIFKSLSICCLVCVKLHYCCWFSVLIKLDEVCEDRAVSLVEIVHRYRSRSSVRTLEVEVTPVYKSGSTNNINN